jgi:hypothetical protein
MDATAAESQAEPTAGATEQDGQVLDQVVDASEDLSPEEEQKRRFRELLEAKRDGSGKGSGGGSGDQSKIHGTHGQAGNKRQFRRKSGG